MRNRSTFTKRQKEQARKEKRRLKVERKQQRKLLKDTTPDDTAAGIPAFNPGEDQSS